MKADSSKDGSYWSDTQISEELEVSVPTIWRVRRRFVEEGLDDALNRRPQPERPSKRIFDREKEVHLIALTRREKPGGEGRWSVRLLAERFVRLGEVEQVSHETVRQVLKKTSPKTLAERAMVYSTQSQCRFCGPYGRYPGRLPPPV